MADFGSKRLLRSSACLIQVLLLVSLLSCSEVLAQEKTSAPTNEALLRQTIGEVLQDCLPEAPVDSQMVWVREEGENPSAWIVREEIVSSLAQRGPVGIGKEGDTAGLSMTLWYRIIKLSLQYPEVKKKSLFGKSWIRREAQAALSFSLSDSSGKVLWSKRGERKTLIW